MVLATWLHSGQVRDKVRLRKEADEREKAERKAKAERRKAERAVGKVCHVNLGHVLQLQSFLRCAEPWASHAAYMPPSMWDRSAYVVPPACVRLCRPWRHKRLRR